MKQWIGLLGGGEGEGVLPLMAYTGSLRARAFAFSFFRYIQE